MIAEEVRIYKGPRRRLNSRSSANIPHGPLASAQSPIHHHFFRHFWTPSQQVNSGKFHLTTPSFSPPHQRPNGPINHHRHGHEESTNDFLRYRSVLSASQTGCTPTGLPAARTPAAVPHPDSHHLRLGKRPPNELGSPRCPTRRQNKWTAARAIATGMARLGERVLSIGLGRLRTQAPIEAIGKGGCVWDDGDLWCIQLNLTRRTLEFWKSCVTCMTVK